MNSTINNNNNNTVGNSVEGKVPANVDLQAASKVLEMFESEYTE